MRVALLSMLECAGEAADGHKAFLAFAGKTLAARQLELALALGCERVVCLSDNFAQPLIALQHKVEAAGARFHVISGPRALSGLVHSDDDLIVLADGILPMAEEARALLSKGNTVLVLPAEAGISVGFERIDLNHAWAGALAMPGALVERLNQLPPDCDAVASLLRIALQARVPERLLPEAVLTEGRWAMLATQDHAWALEPIWIRRLLPPVNLFAPGRSLTVWAVGRFGTGWLQRGTSAALLAGGAILLAGLALVLGWYASAPAGLALVGLAWLAGEAGLALGLVERAGNLATSRKLAILRLAGWGVDAAIVVLIAWGIGEGFTAWPERLFTPLALVGLLRIVAGLGKGRWPALCEDRAVLALVLGFAGMAGFLLPVAQLLALVLLVAGIGLSRPVRELTQA